MDLIQQLSTRDLAIILWLCLGFIWAFTRPTIRHALLRVLAAFFQPKLYTIYLAVIIYIALEIVVLSSLKMWCTDNLVMTLVWALTTGFLFIMNHQKATRNDFFKNTLKEQTSLAVVLEFIFATYTFHFIVEILLIPILFILAAMKAVAENKTSDTERLKPVRYAINAILALFGLGIIAYSAIKIAHDPGDFFSYNTLIGFTLPIALTALYLPVPYFLATFIVFERFSARLKILVADSSFRKTILWQTLLHIGIRNHLLDQWTSYFNPQAITSTSSLKDDIKIFKKYRGRFLGQACHLIDGVSSVERRSGPASFSCSYDPIELGESEIIKDKIWIYVGGQINRPTSIAIDSYVHTANDNEATIDGMELILDTFVRLVTQEALPDAARHSIQGQKDFDIKFNDWMIESNKHVWPTGLGYNYSLKLQMSD